MSRAAFQWAGRQTAGSSSTKTVLLVIAAYTGANHSCSLWQDHIAFKVEMSPRSLRRHLVRLEDLGRIRRERQYDENGYRTHDRYTLLIAKEHTA